MPQILFGCCYILQILLMYYDTNNIAYKSCKSAALNLQMCSEHFVKSVVDDLGYPGKKKTTFAIAMKIIPFSNIFNA